MAALRRSPADQLNIAETKTNGVPEDDILCRRMSDSARGRAATLMAVLAAGFLSTRPTAFTLYIVCPCRLKVRVSSSAEFYRFGAIGHRLQGEISEV